MTHRTSAEPTFRVFYALWPDRRARAALSRLAQEVAHDGHGRAPRENNLHVTIAFVGNVTEARIAALATIGQRVAQTIAPFDITLERIGGTSYGIAWLAPESVPRELAALHDGLTDALEADGFAIERRMFRPHVTLARDCARAAHRGGVAPIRWHAERVSLEASTLAAGGSRYQTLASWPFSRTEGRER